MKNLSPSVVCRTLVLTGTAAESICDVEMHRKQQVNESAFQDGESILNQTQIFEREIETIGIKIKQHEDSLRLKKAEKNQLDEAILDLQVILGKSVATSASGSKDDGSNCDEVSISQKILQNKNSTVGVQYHMIPTGFIFPSNTSNLQDVVGIVASLGKVENPRLSRVLSEYLGAETMMAFVCTTRDGVRALETWHQEGEKNTFTGLDTSVGSVVDCEFSAICLEDMIPHKGNSVEDTQRRLDLVKPKLRDGNCPPGFLGFAVNMIIIDHENLFSVRNYNHGLRESLFFSLFSHLQVYETREHMLAARACIGHDAVSLDGAILRTDGSSALDNWSDLNVESQSDSQITFPIISGNSGSPNAVCEVERKLNEKGSLKRKILEDIETEQEALHTAKKQFTKKKDEFMNFIVSCSSLATVSQDRSSCIR